MKNKIKQYYKQAIVLIIAIIAIGGYFYPELAMGARTSNFWKTVGGKLQVVNDITVKITGDLEFTDEIKPDGALCANGQILKKTGADNWDCAADDGGAGSTTFVGMTDTPANYTGSGSKVVAVNAGETALEFISAGAGTVTSVAMSVPTGLTITGSPITTSGTLALTLTGGYQMLTDVASTTWDGKWDALSDITLAHQSIFAGDGSNNPVATNTITILDNGNIGIGTTTPAYTLDVYGNIRADGDVRTTGTFYGDTWSSITANSMAIQPTGDTDDFFSFKTPANRPTIKREGGKFIYLESSNVYDVGISARADDTYSGTLNYEKDNHMMTMLGKASPLGFKANSDYDDYIKIQTANNTPELSVASSSAFKINAGGTNSLLLNHSGGNVGIGTSSPNYILDVYGNGRFDGNLIVNNASTTQQTNSGDSWFGSDIYLGDDQYIYFDTNTPEEYGMGYNSVAGLFMLGTVNTTIDYGVPAKFTIYSNVAIDGSGSFEPTVDFNVDGSVHFQNTSQGNVGDRIFKVTMTDGMDIILGDLDVIAGNILTPNILYATTTKSVYASTTQLTVSGDSWFNTIKSGTWNGTALTDAYVSNTLTVDGYMQDTDIDTFAELQSWAVGYVDNNTTYTGGTGITLTGTVFSTTDSEIVHDNLSGFVANEHLDWTADLGAVNINAGNYTDTNTNANTVCAGGTTYMDGEGNCDDISSVYEGTLTNSAGLLAALSDETGTGVAVFGTSPTITTSIDLPAGAINTATEIAADIITHTQIADSDQVDTKCIYFEDPTATDDFNSIWTANGFAATITKIWCESDQTVNMDLAVDDGTVADVNGTDLVCDSTPAEDESMGGDATLADGDRLDLLVTSVSGTPTWVSICWTYQFDD